MGGCFAYGINKSINKPAWARGAIVKKSTALFRCPTVDIIEF